MDEIKQIVKNAEPIKIVTRSGDEITLPKLDLLKELEILGKFSEILEKGDVKELKASIIFRAIFKNKETIDKFLDILSIFTGKPLDYVKDNFDIKGVVAALLPFFSEQINEIAQAITKAIPEIGKVENIH